MADDTLYITPHEAALAVVATSMKKARLRPDTLIVNAIAAGILFSAGGMLALLSEAENPVLMNTNPGIVHMLQGAMFPIGLFYVVIMGTELFNSNILYFTVGVCRGAVTIVDLLISWTVTWFINLGATLFVVYVICHWSGVTQSTLFVEGSIRLANTKMAGSFAQQFIRGCAGNFCVCLAVYLQLLAKPVHVKFFLMFLPIFTFVTMGFFHCVADMFTIPAGMFNGADITVGQYILKGLFAESLGNIVGGAAFSILIPFYLHLVVVERDRDQLNLPKYEVKDEQPELQFDSRVVRVPTPSDSSTDSSEENEKDEDVNPTAYRPDDEEEAVQPQLIDRRLSRTRTMDSRRSSRSRTSSKLRSPPGVFPVMGMGKPLYKESEIAGEAPRSLDAEVEGDYPQSLESESIASGASLREIQEDEEREYNGYNARANSMGGTLLRVMTHRPAPSTNHSDLERGLRPVQSASQPRKASSGASLFRTLSRSITSISGKHDSARDIANNLQKYGVTPHAARASDNIAGMDSYNMRDMRRAHAEASERKEEAQNSRRNSSNPDRLSPNTSRIDTELAPRESDEDREDEPSIRSSEDSDTDDPSGKTLA